MSIEATIALIFATVASASILIVVGNSKGLLISSTSLKPANTQTSVTQPTERVDEPPAKNQGHQKRYLKQRNEQPKRETEQTIRSDK